MADYFDGVRILKSKETNVPIGIEWQMDDGSKKRYYPNDVNEEWFIEFCNSVREEKNHRDRIYRNCIYFDPDELDWKIFFTEITPASLYENDEEIGLIKMFINELTEKEKSIFLIKMEDPKISQRGIASRLKISKTSVFYQLKKLQEKYLMFIK